MTTTPQAALLSRMDAYLSGNSCEATAIIKNARDLLAKLQATQEPGRVFPPRIMELLEQVADRNPGTTKGPWEDAQGLPMQDDADAAISWIKARSVATQELVQAGSASLLDGCKSIMDSIAVSSSVIEHNKQAEPVQAGELPALPHDGWPARFRCDSCDGNGEIGELISMGHFQPPERQTCPDCGGRGWSDEGPAFNADHMRDYARAVLSARKPLTMLEPTQIADACAGIYASDHAGKAYDQAVAIAAITEFCRINGIGLEVKP